MIRNAIDIEMLEVSNKTTRDKDVDARIKYFH